MSNINRVLIAGVGGVLGRELLENFRKKSVEVIGLAVNEREFKGLEGKLLKPLVADVTRPETLTGVCQEIDAVVSVIGISRIKGDMTHMSVDYQGNANLLAEAQRAGVKKFVFISPAGTDAGAKQGVPLMEAKFRFEEELKASGLEWLIVRAGGFMRDFAEMARMAKEGSMYIIGDGSVLSTPLDVRELARFMVEDTLNVSNQQVDVGGPEDMTWNEICQASFDFWGKKSSIIRLPPWLCALVLWPMKFFAPKEYALGKMVMFFSLNSVPTHRRGQVAFKAFLKEYYAH